MNTVIIKKAPLNLACTRCGHPLEPRKPYIIIEGATYHEKCAAQVVNDILKTLKGEAS